VRKYASLQVLETWQVPAGAGSRAIRKAAHRVEFEYEPRPGYLYVRSRMISSRCNDNHDEFPGTEIEQGWKSFIGKPVFVNHHNSNHRRARGVIVAASLHRDRNPDGSPDIWVEGLMELDAVRFPLLAKAVLAKRVNRTSMGVDVEWSKCSACGNKATSPAEYCRHLPALKGKKIRQRDQTTGKLREEIIREICHGLSFFENSLLVEDPADPTAFLLGEPDARGLGKAASLEKTAGEPDFRDHLGNHCLGCGKPVRPHPRKGFVHYSGDYGVGHAAMPSDPDDRTKVGSMSFGGTDCLMCREPVRINLNKLDSATGGWHHHDGLKRDHPAIPSDPQAVYDAIPGHKARYEQARRQVGDQLHSQFEQLSGHPLPRRPRGDEAQMPPDPFTASRKGRSMRTTAPPLRYVPLMAEAASRPAYPNPADHPFYKANPVSAQNVVDKFHKATDNERALGARWYSDAHHLARAIANGDAAKGAGVLSAYSPQAGWGVNMHNASKAFRSFDKDDVSSVPGKGSGAMGMHQKAAHRILSGEHYNSVLRAPKTNAFAHLIEHGDDSPEDKARGHSHVVMDRHAMSVALGRRTTQDDDLSFLSNPHYYEHAAQTYRDATHEINQKHGTNYAPHQIQAITWGVQKRENDEAQAGTATGKGRISREKNDFTRWNEHAREHHPDLPRGGDDGNMHVSKAMAAALHALAFGETKVPAQVNTLRAENCPVCGEQDAWSGERCPVCGFVTPPSMFRDPDTDKAGDVRDQLDQDGEVNLPPESEEAAAARSGDGDPQGSDPDADQQMDHPDQPAPNGVPAAQGPGSEAPAEENPEDPSEEGQDESNAEASALGCPACGAQLGAQEPGAAEGAPCPQCGNGRLGPVGNDPAAQKEQRPSGPGGTVMGSAKEAAAAAGIQRQAALERENRVLRAQLAMLASLAGVGPEMDAIRRQADMMNPASPVPDPPEQPATQSTEEALQAGSAHADGGQQGTAPMGGGHAVDDVSRPGTTPGSVTNVPAVATTTPLTPGEEVPVSPATNLVDVTAPVQGTNPAQDGGVPLDQRRIETDVRIDPDPLKASGPGIGGQGDDGTAYPWILGEQQGQQKAASLQDQSAERTFAAIRLARLRVQAGLDQGDELAVAAGIEKDAALTMPVLTREIETLSRVASAPPRRTGQQRTASRPPSLAPSGAPMMAYASAASTDAGDAEDIFLA
jgi:rubrerythrin